MRGSHVKDTIQEKQSSMIESFQSAFKNEELLAKIIELCPFQIEVFNPDGISVLVNQAALKEFNIPSADMVIGKYNLLKDPSIQAMGYMDEVKKAFQGETVFLAIFEPRLKTYLNGTGSMIVTWRLFIMILRFFQLRILKKD
jgi:PAS domain-containing protein